MSCGASFFLAAINLREAMIAPGRAHGKSFLDAANGLETGKIARRAITKTLKAPTITPYFGQSPVTLGWDNSSVASRPGPVRVPDSSAPQPPGAQPTGPVEFCVRFNPLISLRAGSNAGLIFLCARKSSFRGARAPISGLPEIGNLICPGRLKPTWVCEPGIQMQAVMMFLDSGFALTRAPE
jgi:hypothetical protein